MNRTKNWALGMIILFLTGTGENKIKYSGEKLEIFDKGTKIKLIGDTEVRNDKNILTAQQVVISKNKRLMEAKGNVRMANTEKELRYEGQEATYDYEKKYFFSDKKPILFDEKEKFFLSCNWIEGYLDKNITHVNENVYIKKYDDREKPLELFGDNGTYYSDIKKAVLIGNTRMIDADIRASSEEMIYYQREKRVVLSSNVTVYSHKNGISNTIEAQWIEYHFLNDEVFYCHTNVKLYDSKENIIETEQLAYYPEQKYSYVIGNPVLQNSKHRITLKGDIFEYFEDRKILYAKGNVELSSSDYQAKSAMAIYWIEVREILLYGNPQVTEGEDKNTLYAERIRFDMEQEIFKMENQVLGSLEQ